MAKAQDNTKKTWGIIVVILLVGGVIGAYIGANQVTQNQSNASIVTNLNSSEDIDQTNNADGTMGPSSWQGNFSNTLPSDQLGSLALNVTDPIQGLPSQAHLVSDSITPGGGNSRGRSLDFDSLEVTISKVEVHLAYLGTPGSTDQQNGVTPGQGVDKWETLDIGAPKSVDLIQLAKTNDLASLGLTKLAAGRYTQVRLYISSAQLVLPDESTVPLTILGKAGIVKVVQSFVIDPQKTTNLTLDFDAQRSVIKAGDRYLLKPVIAHLLESH